MYDIRTVVDQIVHGNFPDGDLTPDNKVSIINYVVEHLASLSNPTLSDQANTFVIWLGGLNQDLRCYGIQLLIKYQQIEFDVDEKSQERIDTVWKKVTQSHPYRVSDYESLTKYHWPKEFTNTFEERLEALAGDFESEESPADLLLGGVKIPENLDFNQRLQLAQDCVDSLGNLYAKYGKSNILFEERIEQFLAWSLTIEPEIAQVSFRILMSIKQVSFNGNNVPSWKIFEEIHSNLISEA